MNRCELHKCIIVGAGDFQEKTLPYETGDYLIAADGGLRYLDALGLKPDLVIGDFDSLGETPTHEHVCLLPVEKDVTDMQAAVRKGAERGYDSFLLYGGCGGRIDHLIANIQMLADMADNGLSAVLFGNTQMLQMLKGPGSVTLHRGAGDGLSVFAYSPVCRGLSERGVKYRVPEAYVCDGVLTNSYPTAVSNSFIEETAVISVSEGMLLLVSDR